MTGPNADRYKRIWLALGLGLIVCSGLFLISSTPRSDEEGPTLAETGLNQPADYSWLLQDLDGKVVPLSEYKGKTVFLNIWATWCGPCVREMPSIAQLAANPKLKNVAFLCVATDDTAEDVKAFLKGKDYPMTVLRATGIPPVFATQGIPATFLIAPDGRIAASQIGSSEWNTPEVIATLESLGKPTPTPAPAPTPTPKPDPADAVGK